MISCQKCQDTLQSNTCVKYCVCRHCQDKRSKGNNDLNAMYVDTVETKRKYTKLDYICLFIYYVDTVDTTFTEYTTFNGTYVDTVDMI